MPISTHHTQIVILKNFEKKNTASNILFNWFSNNNMITNAGKCHLPTSTSEEVSVKIDNETIKNSLQEKFFGIGIDSWLTFKPHMENIFKQAGHKLSMLWLELLIKWT